nr:MAG: putative RNA-dependent RNA polymerase [Narnaviridae sp.]
MLRRKKGQPDPALAIAVAEVRDLLRPRLVGWAKNHRVKDDTVIEEDLTDYCPKGDLFVDGVLHRVLELYEQGGLTGLFAEADESLDRAAAVLDSLLTICRMFGLSDLTDRSSISRFLVKYTLYFFLGLGEKMWKFQSAYVFANRAKQSELPPVPDQFRGNPMVLVGGKVGRFLRCRMKGFTDQCLSIAFSIKESKRGGRPVNDAFKAEAIQKHEKILCEPRDVDPDDRHFDRLISEVRRTVREVFPRRRLGVPKFRHPSASAHYGWTRKVGGALEYLRQRFHTVSDRISPLELVRMDERAGSVWEQWGRIWDEHTIVSELRRAAKEETCLAKPQCILEPFKVRVITTGEPARYVLARMYQKPIHDLLGQHPTFCYTHGPVTEDNLTRYMAKYGFEPTGFWVSGDYESATDNLDPTLSEVCLEAIWERLGLDLTDLVLLLPTMSQHQIDYTEWGSEVRKQVWGQLMGSPLSFPILCLINAAVTRYSYELVSGQQSALVDLPIVINGDDVLFYAKNSLHYEVWKTETARAGLKFSLGKNYTSPDFAMINSVLFRCSVEFPQLPVTDNVFGVSNWHNERRQVGPQWGPLSGANHIFRRIPYVNVGLLFGQGKVLNVSSDLEKRESSLRGPANVGACAQTLVDGFTGQTRERLIGEFINRNLDALKQAPPGVDWFLPRFLGGLGLPVPAGYQISESSRKIAAWLSCLDVDKYCSLQLSLRGSAKEDYLVYALKQQASRSRKLGFRPRYAYTAGDEDSPRSMASCYWYLGTGDSEDNLHESFRAWRRAAKLWSKKGLAHGLKPMSTTRLKSLTEYPRRIILPGSGRYSPVPLVI